LHIEHGFGSQLGYDRPATIVAHYSVTIEQLQQLFIIWSPSNNRSSCSLFGHDRTTAAAVHYLVTIEQPQQLFIIRSRSNNRSSCSPFGHDLSWHSIRPLILVI
jgi:hypothetical protein